MTREAITPELLRRARQCQGDSEADPKVQDHVSLDSDALRGAAADLQPLVDSLLRGRSFDFLIRCHFKEILLKCLKVFKV